jgi:hypothetical protein
VTSSASFRTVVADFEEPGWDYGVLRSPYHEFHRANGAKYCVYNNRLMPVSQGRDRFSEYWTLRRGVGVWDTGERPTEIAGPDAETLCNKLFTRDYSKLKPGRASYGLLLYPDGGILTDGVLLRFAKELFWFVQPDGPAYAWLVAHAQGLNVTIRDPLLGRSGARAAIARCARCRVRRWRPRAIRVLRRSEGINGRPKGPGHAHWLDRRARV